MTDRLHIVTGAPGVGKTAILDDLRADIRYVPEPAREVLARQRTVQGSGVPDRDPSLFVDLLLQASIDKHREARTWGHAVLFDRGIPDCVAYALLLGTDPEPSVRAAGAYRYRREVLVARPWEEIYRTDNERRMTFAATLEFQRLIEEAYERTGYTLVEIPRGTLPERVAFVREFVRG